MEIVYPILPLQRKSNEFKGYRFEEYDYNGWVYDLSPGKYVISLATSPNGAPANPNDFMLRVRGPAKNNQPLFTLESR
jgi:hypothetical protein